jgi:hypothetical protein
VRLLTIDSSVSVSAARRSEIGNADELIAVSRRFCRCVGKFHAYGRRLGQGLEEAFL